MDQKAKALDEKNTLLEQNLKTLVNVDETDLDKKYQLVAASLPDLPDPIAILTKINTMSTKAGVGIEDFQFTVASESATVDIAKKEQLTTNVSFSIRADIKSTKDFLHEFSRSFPLSIVDVIEKREDVTMVEIKSGFPHKPFPVFSFQSDEQLQPLNEGEIKELDKLFTFSSGLTDTTVVISSSSANRGDNGPF